jgi:hypothetical protein
MALQRINQKELLISAASAAQAGLKGVLFPQGGSARAVRMGCIDTTCAPVAPR